MKLKLKFLDRKNNAYTNEWVRPLFSTKKYSSEAFSPSTAKSPGQERSRKLDIAKEGSLCSSSSAAQANKHFVTRPKEDRRKQRIKIEGRLQKRELEESKCWGLKPTREILAYSFHNKRTIVLHRGRAREKDKKEFKFSNQICTSLQTSPLKMREAAKWVRKGCSG